MICLGSFLRVFPWEHMWVLCHQLLIQFHCFQSHLFLPFFWPFLLTLQLCLRAPTLPGLGYDASTVSSLSSHFAPPLNTVDALSFSKHFPFSASVTSHLLAGLFPLCLLIFGIPNSSMGSVLYAPQPEHPSVWPGFDNLPYPPVQCGYDGPQASALEIPRSSHWRVCLPANDSKCSSSLSSTCAHQTAHLDAPWEF